MQSKRIRYPETKGKKDKLIMETCKSNEVKKEFKDLIFVLKLRKTMRFLGEGQKAKKIKGGSGSEKLKQNRKKENVGIKQ